MTLKSFKDLDKTPAGKDRLRGIEMRLMGAIEAGLVTRPLAFSSPARAMAATA